MSGSEKMRHSTPPLSEFARHLVYPSGIVSTGWPRIEKRLADMGVQFDSWQEDLSRLILGKRANGQYAATVGGVTLSIPRQVGKTFTLGSLVVALCLEYPGMTVIWTAHHQRTSTRTFRSLQDIVRSKNIAPHLAATTHSNGIRATNGEQEISFRNGSEILFGARKMGFGRGFDQVEVEVFDEAQILDNKSLEDMVAATNQATHPAGALLFFIGTPPKPDDTSEAFTTKRDQALSGDDDDGLYLELSADPDCNLDDRAQWSKANPSYPKRTPLESMKRLRANLADDESWRREALGIWDAQGDSWVIPEKFWQAASDLQSQAVESLALGVETGYDLEWASVSLAGRRADGGWHVELHERQEGTSWVVPLVRDVLDRNPNVRAVVADAGSPSKALFDEFERHKIKVTLPKVHDLGVGCARLLDGIVSGNVRHIGQGQMDSAVASAGKRELGDTGMWAWSRKTSASDITPIQSATLALMGAQNEDVKRPVRRTSGNSKVVIPA